MYKNHGISGQPLQKQGRNTIRVTGKGTVEAKPNKAETIFGVSAESSSLAEAQAEAAQTIAGIKDGLIRIGIPEENIQTKDYSVFPQYDFQDGKQIFRGYKAEHLLRVIVSPVEAAGRVLDAAAENGANIISSVRLLADDGKWQKQALSLAVIDAYEKAAAIAKTLNVQLIKTPVSVTEGIIAPGQPIPREAGQFVKSAAAGTSIEPGTTEITAYVTAEFVY
ncbi:SIMPL domain-containing protein [Bacillus infantis]|uniref:SIMPL domain-containing protein n=1 Tax=Bacillus infantis TaxID=324767 RepID=UPI001CD64B3C|nr:SIMPL domain-containing protein [Bacillus infantis]MCA1039169.1 SIMPL domain-containing protein [Bacillus infantis]